MSDVIVIGSLNHDIVARVPHIPRPGETLIGSHVETFAGGKGLNQAIAASRMGGKTSMVGKVGADGAGHFLTSFLKDNKVNTKYCVSTDDALTGTAMINVSDAGENAITVIAAANGLVNEGDIDAAPINAGDIVVLQNEIPTASIAYALQQAKSKGATTIYNPAPALRIKSDVFSNVDILVVNETECAFYGGVSLELEALKALKGKLGLDVLILTRGADGLLALHGDKVFDVPGHKVNVVDTTGAGDCFVGSLAAGLALGQNFEQALMRANKAASLSVQKAGAGNSMPYAKDLMAV
ncbi:MAG: ribokinase [Micavibrio sp.]|nr:ribokinase [Micavibrio sp.]|tara:strand:+ start:798 stop:1685 length:888 start_codon:yes stop_codon:yes gene_type:complete